MFIEFLLFFFCFLSVFVCVCVFLNMFKCCVWSSLVTTQHWFWLALLYCSATPLILDHLMLYDSFIYPNSPGCCDAERCIARTWYSTSYQKVFENNHCLILSKLDSQRELIESWRLRKLQTHETHNHLTKSFPLFSLPVIK